LFAFGLVFCVLSHSEHSRNLQLEMSPGAFTGDGGAWTRRQENAMSRAISVKS
jgi:hypothetical protein